MNFKKTAIAIAMTASMGFAASAANAAIVTASWEGVFTMLDPLGGALMNTPTPYCADPTWGFCKRTPITGTLSFDTSTGAGAATVNSFEFFGGGPLVVHDFTLQAIGNGVGGAGTLVAGGMLLDWNGNNPISVGIILDAAGFFGSLPVGTGATISGVGAIPASNTTNAPSAPAIGPSPIATTTWNTDFNMNPGCAMTASCLTSNDTVGGDPMDNGPFPGFNANFDIISITTDMVTTPPVPVPAAAWLFGSGLLGLIGVARKKTV